MRTKVMNQVRELIVNSFIYSLIAIIAVWASKAYFFTVKVYKGHHFKEEYVYKTEVYHVLNRISDWLERKLYKPFREAFFRSYIIQMIIQGSKWVNESFVYKTLAKFNLVYLLIFYVYVDRIVRSYVPSLASIWDELLLVVFIGWIIVRRVLFKKRFVFTNIDIILISFIFIYTSIMFIYSPDLQVGIEGLRAVVQYMFWFFMATQYIDKEDILENVLFLCVLGIALMGLHGTYQYFTGAEMLGNWVDSSETIETRAYSIAGGPNALASILVLGIPIAFSMFITEKDILKKIVYLVATAFMGLGLIFTFSRGGWLAAFLAVVIFFMFIARRMIVSLTTLLLAAVVVVEALWLRIYALFTKEYISKASDGGRIYRWTTALESWSETKTFGLGVGRFGGAVATNHGLSPFYMDNYYLKTLTESGIVGLGAYVILQISTVWNMFFYIRGTQNERYRIIMLGIFAGLIGVLIHNGVENIFESPFSVVYYWTLVGVLVSMYKIDKKGEVLDEN